MQEELSGRPMEARQFPQTRWSLVLAAGSNDEEALNELFQIDRRVLQSEISPPP